MSYTTGSLHEIYIPRKNPLVFEKGIGQVVYEDMKKWSDKIAQIDAVTGKKETYADLLSRTIRTAQNMRHKGIKPEDVVSLLSYNNMDFTCVTLASFFTGALNAPMDPTSPLIDLIHCLKLTAPKILFCEEELESTAEEAIKSAGITAEIVIFGKTDRNVSFSDYLVEREPESSFQIHPVTDVKSAACLHFSSGTTGFPKAVCVTHYALMFGRETFPEMLENYEKCELSSLNLRSNLIMPKKTMTVTSPFWISNMSGMITGFLCGDTRIMMKVFEVKLVMKYVYDYQINLLMMTPANGAALIENPEYFQDYDLSCLKIIGTGGSVTTSEKFLAYRRLFPKTLSAEGYGMTEAGAVVLQPVFPNAEDFQNNKTTSIGTPIPGYRYKVVDTETEEAVGPNNKGELRVKCDGMMSAYYKNPEAYKNAFDSAGYYKSGDIVIYDEDYKFYYVTRIKDIFKYKGWHIPPLTIEDVLITHPNIKQAIVIGIPEKQFGELATAAIVLKDPVARNEQEIIDFIAERLPERYQLHGGVYILDEIPVTSTGKIRRRNLTEMILKLKSTD